MNNLPTRTRPRLLSLEVLRAVAAVLVVLFHLDTIFAAKTDTVPFSGWFSQGSHGVDVFFVLSGFIIAHVHGADIGQPARFGRYLFNRFARIIPALWVMSLFALAVYAAGFGGAEKSGKLSAGSLAASFLLLPQSGFALLNVSWTLKYEMFFYLIFGIAIINKRLGVLVFMFWQVAIVVTALLPSATISGPAAYYLNPLCLEFSLGIACAWLLGSPVFCAFASSVVVQSMLTALAMALLLFGLDPGLQSRDAVTGAMFATGAALAIVGCVSLERAGRLKIPGLLAGFGGASYSIYLVHYSAITLMAVMLVRIHTAMNNYVFTSVAVVSITLGLMFDRVLDQPAQRMLRERLRPALLKHGQRDLPLAGSR